MIGSIGISGEEETLLNNLYAALGNEDLEGWKVLATKEAALLKSYYPDASQRMKRSMGLASVANRHTKAAEVSISHMGNMSMCGVLFTGFLLITK